METISLNEAFERDLKDEKMFFEKIQNEQNNDVFFLSLARVNRTFFLYRAFEDHDFQRSKNFLYKTAMCNSYYFEIYTADAFATISSLIFPLLSDSQKAIERYLNYPYLGMEPKKVYAENSFNTYFAQAIQSVLRDNDEGLQKQIEGLQKRIKRGEPRLYAGVVPAFEGLLLKNKEQIEYGIYELLKTHKRQSPNKIDSKYINYPATAIAKLAYHKGIEVQIDNPLVSLELLPIKELDKYERYDFFDELK